MVLTFLVGFGAVFGASEGIRASQAKSRREEHRSRKNNLVVRCPKGSTYSSVLENRRVVLSGDKLYVDTGTEYSMPFGHPFSGYYMSYPEQPYSGLVSSITDEAPIMNWVYVNRETYELKFGTRQFSEGHFTGPWDCTRQDRRLTFGGWEGFCAVKEGDFWSIYFDRDNDLLRSKLAPGTPVIELELIRKEPRTPRPPPPPAIEPGPQQESSESPPTRGEVDGAQANRQESQTAEPGQGTPRTAPEQNPQQDAAMKTPTKSSNEIIDTPSRSQHQSQAGSEDIPGADTSLSGPESTRERRKSIIEEKFG